MPRSIQSLSAAIITIGSELTSGRIVDTNSSLLARALISQGFELKFHNKVPDESTEIRNAVKNASQRVGLILLCGGLGPTDDDITTSVITHILKRKLVRDKEALNHILGLVGKRRRILTAADLKMVSIPSGAKIFKNSNGMAPGYYLRYNKSFLIVTPAVPRELECMLQNEILPFLKTKVLGKKRPHYQSRVIRIFGIPESLVNQAVKRAQIAKIFPEIKIGYQCPIPEIQVILELLKKDSPRNLQGILNQAEEKLHQVLGKAIFGINDQTLSQVVHNLFLQKQKTLSLAESCTGGLLSTSLTDHSGSSAYFLGSIVCYSNESKIRDLGVAKEILEKSGAVNSDCAQAMAKGVRERFDSDIGLSITGIAGPEGGSPEKPVGTVFIGVDYKGKISHARYRFRGGRQDVRRFAVFFALNHLRLLL